MGLQERRGYQIGNVTFDRAFHDVGLIFTPSDTNDTTSRHQIGYTQRNGAAGNILARIELRRCHVASIATEQHQTAGRVELRTRFVKCQISDRTDLAQSQIDTTASLYFFFVIFTILVHIFFRYQLTGRMNILGIDIHLVEQQLFQQAHRPGSSFCQRIIFPDIEYYDIRETDFAGLIHAYQFGINGVSTDTRTQSEHTMTMLCLAFLYQFRYVMSYIHRPFLRAFEDFGVNFLVSCKSRKFQLTIRSIIPFRYPIQFNLRT